MSGSLVGHANSEADPPSLSLLRPSSPMSNSTLFRGRAALVHNFELWIGWRENKSARKPYVVVVVEITATYLPARKPAFTISLFLSLKNKAKQHPPPPSSSMTADHKAPVVVAANDDETVPSKKQKTMDAAAADNTTTTDSTTANNDDETSTSLIKTHAFGKLILFGEHFVVYNVPALVGAVAAYTDCALELVDDDDKGNDNKEQEGEDVPPPKKKNFSVVDNRPAVPNYKDQKAAEGEEAIALVLKHFQLQETSMKLTFGGTLCCVSGIGASAAQCVSLARAIQQTIPKWSTLTDDEINAAGYEGERGYHGTPSGIDNTAATFGGLLRFQRTSGDPLFVKKKLSQPIRIVYASTGITASTTKVVGDVRAKKEANEPWFAELLAKYTALVPQAEQAMETGDMKLLGSLLNENHALCQELTVSCKELDDLVTAARTAGAYGAKMSGTGRGGLMMALTPTIELQEAVATALEQAGAPQVWKTTFE